MIFKTSFCRLLLVFLTMSLFSVHAATLYVATTGSDSNPGTAAQPFRTITYAYSQAGAGTTILVAPGTYTDYTSGWGIHLGKSGTASSPIVLESQVRGGAIIDGQFASDRNTGIYIDGTYNVVIGFGITRSPTTGVVLYGNSNQILNDEIYNNGTQGSTDPEGQGIYSGHTTSGNIYDGNYIHDNGYAGSNLDHGLYLCGQNEVVVNNVVVRNASYGLQIAGYNTVSGMKVYNNVMAYNGKSGIILWMSLNGVDIENNIIYKNGILGIDSYQATGSGVVVDHNLVFGNGSGNYDLTDDSSDFSYSLGTTISSDPLFVNETSSAFDAHLSAGSPAIGAGLNFYSVLTYDLADASRPSTGAWDLGAYVYGASTTTNVAPPTVSITSPANGVTVSSSGVSVLASASSSIGIAGVQFKLDGANIGSVFTSAPYGGAWDSTTVANGAHTFTAVATDTAGKQTTSTAVTILVSNLVATLPLVSITSPTTGATVSGSVSVLASASSSIGIAGVQFELDGADIGPVFTNAPYGGAWDSTAVTDGAHTFIAVATDTAGKQTISMPVTILVSNTVSTLGLPIVSVGATTPNASRVGSVDGVFTLTRSGNTSSPLIVYYTLGGTATNGADYATLGTSLTIPAGAASAAITVAPLPSSNLVGTETAVLALSANSAYATGSANSGTVTIAGNSVPSTIGNAPGHAVKITWKSVAGKIYVVADKTSLSETTWTKLSGSITATGSSTSYTDTTVNNHTVRYYVVYVTD
jgi:hypothetical protein